LSPPPRRPLLAALLVATSLRAAAAAAASAAADACSPNPCLNGGACVDARSPSGWVPYTCECAVGFDGLSCEIPALIAVVFSSHAVLQRAPKQAVVFGAANATLPGDRVTLALSGVGEWHAVADATGAWSVALPPQPATAAGATLTATSALTGRVVALSDVVFGDLFVCAGQSNMALGVTDGFAPLASAAEVEALAPRYQLVRLLNNGNFWPWYASTPGSTPVGSEGGNPPGFRLPTAGNGSWHSPGTIANYSAACWFFGSSYFDAMGGAVPVGLIDNSAGGTSIHFWSSLDALAQCSQVTPSSNFTDGGAGELFEAMIAPLSPMALAGVAWFQGESQACGYSAPGAPCGGAYYACQLRAMIEDWRAKLRQPALPFLVIELCGLGMQQWPNIRAAQQAAVAGLAGVATIPNHDLAWQNDMHSHRKVVLGWRKHLRMLALAGNGSVAWSGPVLQSARVAAAGPGAGVTVTLTFTAATSAGLHFSE
jgi:sialate O-acetylesterase